MKAHRSDVDESDFVLLEETSGDTRGTANASGLQLPCLVICTLFIYLFILMISLVA